MTKYFIGTVTDNSSQVHTTVGQKCLPDKLDYTDSVNVGQKCLPDKLDYIDTINIEEKPLLDQSDAAKLAALASAILVLGGLVQVRFFEIQRLG